MSSRQPFVLLRTDVAGLKSRLSQVLLSSYSVQPFGERREMLKPVSCAQRCAQGGRTSHRTN